MSINESLVNAYLRHFSRGQRGGGDSSDIEVFKGMRRWDQSGGGLLLQQGYGPDKVGASGATGIIRAVAPLVAHGVSKFLIDTATDYSKGDNLADAAKKAVLPAILNAVSSGGLAQAGKGRRSTQRGRGAWRIGQPKRVYDPKFAGMGIKAKTSKRKPRKPRKTIRATHVLPGANF